MIDLEEEFMKLYGNINTCCLFCEKSDECGITGLNDSIQKMAQNNTLAFYGVSRVFENLFGVLSEESKKKISYIADIKAIANSFDYCGVRVLSPQELVSANPDIVVLCTYTIMDSMRNTLINAGMEDKKIINLISIGDGQFKFCDIVISQISMVSKNYEEVSITRLEYLDSFRFGEHVRQMCLVKLIHAYLNIRDVLNAEKHIVEYISHKYRNYELFADFIDKLHDLLSNAREELKERSKDAIIIYLFDGISEKMVDNVPALAELRENSLIFDRSFTQYGYTTSSLQVMFTWMDLIDEKAYEIGLFTAENSPLIRTIKSHGYTLKIFFRYRLQLFEGGDPSVTVFECATASHQLWAMLAEILKSNNKSVYYVHMSETHHPFNCGFTENIVPLDWSSATHQKYNFIKTIWFFKALEYINEQFSFFDGLIPSDITKIVMSDHDNYAPIFMKNYCFPPVRCEEYPVYFGVRITLFISSPTIEKGMVKEIFCIKNFHKLFNFIFGELEIKDLISRYTKLQKIPIYDEWLLKHYYQALSLPARGIITAKGTYSIRYDGSETYYPNILENHIDDPQYAEEIEEAREICGKDFHDIFNQPKFANAKEYYAKAGLIKENGDPL
jgi:hypothetical protein